MLRRIFFLTVFLVALCQPFEAMLIPPHFLDCVVALGRKDLIPSPPVPPGGTPPPPTYGPWIPEASGFLFGKFVAKVDEQNNSYVLYLITNRHVIEEHSAASSGSSLWVRFNLTGLAKEYDIPLHDAQGKPEWHFHPNPSVDVAVIQINPDFLKSQGARFSYFRSDMDVLSRAKAKELGLSEGDGVYVLGFPMGLVGQQQEYAIVRQGAIARVRDVLDSSTPGVFLVDSFVFPGNSGGPVVLRPEMIAIQGHQPISSAYLLGIVRSYLPYTDMAISPQTKHLRVTFEENSGLSEVISADHIEETIADYEASRTAH